VSSIHTLIPDIQELLTRKDGWFTDEIACSFSSTVSRSLQAQFEPREARPTLRLSKLGDMCPRALWYSIRHPELAEKMPPWVENKFSFGHIIEAWAIALAKASGHRVEGEQDELRVDGIVGHRDCVLDGCICDVKSVTSYGLRKFQEGTIRKDDSFGYLYQLDGYICGSLEDPLVSVKDKGYILAIDKQLGHMALYEHEFRPELIRERIRDYRDIVSQPRPPACTCEQVPFGKSGNVGLGVRASYSPFKYQCFPELRTFIYSDGPVYLTKVVRRPDVKEIDKFGQEVYTS